MGFCGILVLKRKWMEKTKRRVAIKINEYYFVKFAC